MAIYGGVDFLERGRAIKSVAYVARLVPVSVQYEGFDWRKLYYVMATLRKRMQWDARQGIHVIACAPHASVQRMASLTED